jgi:hypothetical protein
LTPAFIIDAILLAAAMRRNLMKNVAAIKLHTFLGAISNQVAGIADNIMNCRGIELKN